MCLSPEHLFSFISLLSPDLVSVDFDRVTVRAAIGEAVWVAEGDTFCTDARKIDAAARLTPSTRS